jgi:hypothetical protein
MDVTVITYAIYLAISIGLTAWVARTLYASGPRFLVDAFDGDQELAVSANHLLVVGFYLVNFAIICLALPVRADVVSTRTGLEALAEKLGIVLLSMGMIHVVDFIVFTYLRYCHTSHGRAR